MTTQLGLLLRDKALSQSREGRHEAIQRVRVWLYAKAQRLDSVLCVTLTADDVADALESLGLADGETRWSANVLVGWEKVRCTERVVRSRRTVNHGRRIAVWEWL